MTTHVSLAPDAGRRALAARLAGDDAETARERSGLSPAGYRQAIGSELSRLARELESRRSGADQPHDSATLVRYVAGLATPESDPGLAEHIEACESCRSFVEDLRARGWARVSELEAAAAAPAAARAATDPVLGAASARPAGSVPQQQTLGLAPPKVRVLGSAPTAADLTMPEPPTPWWKRRASIAAGAAAALVLVGGGTAFALTSGDGPHGPTAEQLAAQRAAAAKREAAARSAAITAIGSRSTAQQAALDRAAKERAAAAAAKKRAAEKAARKRAAAKAARKRREARERRQAAAAAAAAAAPASTPTPARSAPAPAPAPAPAAAPAPAPTHRSSGGSHQSGPMSQSGGSWGT
jgi:hypothetical protein